MDMKFLLLIIIIFFLTTVTSAQELPFVYYTTENEVNPLPSAAVNNIYQDDSGYMWIAIFSSGIVGYDGTEMEVYNNADGLPSPNVMNMCQDLKGMLWVLTDVGIAVSENALSDYKGGKRVKFLKKLFGKELVQTSISQIGPNCLSINKQGDIWVGTIGLGVVSYKYDSENSLKIDTIKTISSAEQNIQTVYSVYARNNGEVWIGAEDVIFKYDSESNELEVMDSSIPSTHTFFEDDDGTLWGGCESGLIWKYVNSSLQKLEMPTKSVVYGIQKTEDGFLWVNSYGDGILKFNPENNKDWILFTEDNGLLSNNTRGFLYDREKNLWITHSGGISKLRNNYKAFSNLSGKSKLKDKPLLPDPKICAIIPSDKEDSLFPTWLACGEGVIKLDSFTEANYLNSGYGLMSNTVYDLCKDEKGRIWIGDFHGLNCLSSKKDIPTLLPKSKKRIIRFGGENKNLTSFEVGIIGVCNIFDIPLNSGSTEKIQSLWFNSYRRAVCFVNNEWFIFDEEAGVPASIVYSLAMDKNNSLWLGTGDKGLFKTSVKISLQTLQNLKKEKNSQLVTESFFESAWGADSGAPFNEFSSLLWLDGILWTGTSEGLFAVQKEPWQIITKISKREGLHDENIVSMAYDKFQKILWLGTNGGISKIDPITYKILKQIDKNDGLVNNETHWLKSIQTDNKGNVYFGSPQGLTIYNESEDKAEKLPPLIHRKNTGFTEDNQGNNEFVISFAGLSFVNEKAIKYKTRLIGYDEEWSEFTSENKIRYTNLAAYLWDKPYTFEVMANNYYNIWSDKPLQYSFTVTPAWWFRWWAFLLYIILIVVSAIEVRWLIKNWRKVIAAFPGKIAHYRLKEKIGAGGMGEVFRAIDLNTKKSLAVKVLHSELLEEPENRTRLGREGNIMSSFDHPNIIKAFEIGENNGRGFIAMELMTGGTLSDYLKQNHPLSPNIVKKFLMQICSGLMEIHNNNIIHRDMKTGNIMLDENGNVKIMDFGLSKSPLITTMTSLGTVLGTLGYVAPDQITGMNVDHRVDIFSLGVIMYELLMNDLPFKGENEMALIHNIFNLKPKKPSGKRKDLSGKWDDLIFKCLEKEPEDRYNQVEELLEEIENINV